MEKIEEKKAFTRFELPDGVEVVKYKKPSDSVVVYKSHEVFMLTCEDLQSAKSLRTELITSLELLNFYINQIEKDGKIRYVR